MTGTSLDGLDLALVEARGRGPAMTARFLEGRSVPLGALAPRLRRMAEQAAVTAGEIATLALEFGEFHARHAAELVAGRRLHLAALHGQTVFHAPPVSWQFINPFPVARALRCRVVSDLRQADLVAGGQGAPITPLADWVLLRDERPRVVINLGGFCNATALPAATDPRGTEGIRGADLCACNQLLDRAASRLLGVPFDEDGRAARSAAPDPEVADSLAALLGAQGLEGRSLGTGDEAWSWLDRHASAATDDLQRRRLLAGICAGVGAAIAAGCRRLAPHAASAVVAGGGARNQALRAALERGLAVPVSDSESLGLPIEMREAAAMAVLGAMAGDGHAMGLPAVTGASADAPPAGLWIGPHQSAL